MGAGQAAAQADPASVLDTLRPSHPRLMLHDERLKALKEAATTDPVLQRYVEQLKKLADTALEKEPLEHKLTGPRLLSVSRDCVDRTYALALAWRWFGDERYARAAESNLLTVAAFPGWNPSHFLDTAEMAHAVGVGYDWLFPVLSEESRAALRAALIKHGLEPGIAVYKSGRGWPTSDFNWNQVCNGGMMVGALAIAETDPEYARAIVPKAIASLPRALQSYDPDGAWMEGPSYWSYATRYTAYGLCALDTALGTDFGLSEDAGLRASGYFPLYTTGPTGLYLNYADSGERGKRRPMPCMLWLAAKYNDPVLADAEHALTAVHGAAPEHIVWYVPPSGKPAGARDLDRHFRGKVDVVVMRSSWDDPNALFVGVKGGYNQVNHGHLDLGNFEMDALGVRWARDLGSDDYNLPGYWDKKPGGKRWKYFRLNSASHNVPMLNGQDQDAAAVATITRFSSRKSKASVEIDLSSAYPGAARAVSRKVDLIDRRRAVRVTDHFDMATPGAIKWGMTTDAAIELRGDAAVLTLDGKTLHARLESPKGAQFMVESAEREKPEKRNTGVRRLLVNLPQAEGKIEIRVVLAPDWDAK
jgi:hypothetical protein